MGNAVAGLYTINQTFNNLVSYLEDFMDKSYPDTIGPMLEWKGVQLKKDSNHYVLFISDIENIYQTTHYAHQPKLSKIYEKWQKMAIADVSKLVDNIIIQDKFILVSKIEYYEIYDNNFYCRFNKNYELCYISATIHNKEKYYVYTAFQSNVISHSHMEAFVFNGQKR